MIVVVILGLTGCVLSDGLVPIATQRTQRFSPNRFNLLQEPEDFSQTEDRLQLPFFVNPFWFLFTPSWRQPVYLNFIPRNFEEQANGELGQEATGVPCENVDGCVDANSRNDVDSFNTAITTPKMSSIEDISKTSTDILLPPVDTSNIKDFSTSTFKNPKMSNIEDISKTSTDILLPPVDMSNVKDFSTNTITTPKMSSVEDISKTSTTYPEMSSIEDGSMGETKLSSKERSRKKRHLGGGHRRWGGGFGNGLGSLGYFPAGMGPTMGNGFPTGGMGAGMGSGFGGGGVGSGMGAGMGNGFGGSGMGAGMGSGFGGGGMGAGMGSGSGAGGMGSGMGAGMGSGLGAGGMGAGMGSGFGGTGMGAGMGVGMGSALGGMGFGMGAGIGASI